MYFLKTFLLTLLVLISLHSTSYGQENSLKNKNNPAFDQGRYENVILTALIFLQPRTLDPHSIKDLSLWGLNGLNAIDPSLSIKNENGQLYLIQAQATLKNIALPPEDDLHQWTRIIVDFSSLAWEHSKPVQTANVQGMIQAFFDELFDHMDPYSRYIPPHSAAIDRDERGDGEANIGVNLVKQRGLTIITSMNTNGPAWTAGVNIGDRLYKVDNKRTSGQPIPTINQWLKGKINSPLTLTLGRNKGKTIKIIHLTRDMVPPATVFAFTNDNVIILKVTSFSISTAEEINQYLEQAMQDIKLKGLILDLRGNRGGILQQAVTSAALLLDHGVAVTTKGRNPKANHVWAVQGGDLIKNRPIIILVDGRTASAAEILTATLSDHKRAVVVGSTTLGKGLVQTIAQLPDGGELFVTWSRVLAPLGWPIQGLGIIPQACTSHGQQKAKKELKDLANNQSTYKNYIAESRQTHIEIDAKEILKLRNACPPALGSDTDLEIANLILADPALYQKAISMIPNE